MSMQIIVEIENTQAKTTNMKKEKKWWKRWKNTCDCKKQTTWIDEYKRQMICIKCFKQIVFEKFKNLENIVSIWCISKCEINNLIAKKNTCDKMTTTRLVSLNRQIKRYFWKNCKFERIETRQKVWRNLSLMRNNWFVCSLILWKKRVFLTIKQVYWFKFLNEHDEQIVHR